MSFALTLCVVFFAAFHVAESLPSALISCLEQTGVPFVSSTSPGYANETNIYNVRVQYKPLAIATPNSTTQISSALKCAAAANLTVQAKGGGHSYTGFSSGGRDGAFTISLENFQDVIMSPKGYASDVAKVGAGLRLGNMALALYNAAKVGIAHGSCPGVGIGGHATHGGYGLNSRAWGLAMDAIVAMEAVLPNGTLATVTSASNADLWFALRGAADSFAIITNFYMKTRPVPKDLTYFVYGFGNVFGNAEAPRSPAVPTAMFLHLQAFANNASVVDGRISFNSYIDTGTWTITGLFHGTVADFKSNIAPELLRTLPALPGQPTIRAVSWTESLTLLAGSYPVSEPAGVQYNLHDDFYAKSLTVPASGLLTEKALNAFFNYANQHGIAKNGNPDVSWGWYAIFDLWGGAGSAINNLPASGSASKSGVTFWTFQLVGEERQVLTDSGYVWPSTFSSQVRPFLQGLHDSIPQAQPETAFGAYYNYVDDALTPANAHRLYFGDKTYARLLTLKRQIDPGMLITNPLGVGM